MNNQWENRPDIDPDFDPKEIVEDAYKHYTYQDLAKLSKPLDKQNISKLEKWKQFSVISFDNYEQIFHDIANSKKIKKHIQKQRLFQLSFVL